MGLGTLKEVQDGSGDHRVGPGRVGDPPRDTERVGGPLGKSMMSRRTLEEVWAG